MKIFNLNQDVQNLNHPIINTLLQNIEFYRGKAYPMPMMKKLNRLHCLSKRRSTTASNAIEAILISPTREKELFNLGLSPLTYEDFMLTGYNQALETIFENSAYQSLSADFVCGLHRILYDAWNPGFGGRYKQNQNYIKSTDEEGKDEIIFTPPSPRDTPMLIDNLIFQFNLYAADPTINRLLLIADFILNFLCIHPFDDGNGRVSRLLTTFLLLKYGYDLDRYYSLSYLILNSSEDYYASLHASDRGWKENDNHPEPFVIFMLKTILSGYMKLDFVLEANHLPKTNASEKTLFVVNKAEKPISKTDIEEILYSLGRDSIEKSLKLLLKEKKIQIVQKGRYALYFHF